MKQYLLSIYQPDGPMPDAEFLAPIMQDVDALMAEMARSNVLVFTGGLYPPSAATVVHESGGGSMTDGPYAESKEHIGGVVVIRASNLDEALEWARRTSRATTLPIEVRPFLDRGETPS